MRTPVRKALLAGAVTKVTYGRAFGFERMMDMVGAIVGPASAFFLLGASHHVFYAGFAFIAGWLADRFPKHLVLATGYALAAVMALAILFLPLTVWTFGAIFIMGGVHVAIEKTLEDSFCAELVSEEHHGMGRCSRY